MKKLALLTAVISLALVEPITCSAAVSADEAQQLGTTLTPIGAIKAGNKDGTIPPWTGGMTTSPPGYVPGKNALYVYPFKDEKPLFRITGSNYEKYADQLDASQIELLKRNPEYYMDIYPTHRTAAYSPAIYAATERNATQCSTERNGLAVNPSCRGGYPFPIPKTGFEVMWNHLLAYQPPVRLHDFTGYVVDAAGHPYLVSVEDSYTEWSYYIKERTNPQQYYYSEALTKYPAAGKGEIVGFSDFLDPLKYPRQAFDYDPGLRRVKLAPSFAYDTPIANIGGVMLYDELFLYLGAMDRFDFKLIGKKEMYIPYNNYIEYRCPGSEAIGAKNLNPACERWELHRVWEVEADLKPGMRHAYSKRIFYLDEDSYNGGMSDSFDHEGHLYRGGFIFPEQIYDVPFFFQGPFAVYDFIKGDYTMQGLLMPTGNKYFKGKPMDERDMNPDALAGAGND